MPLHPQIQAMIEAAASLPRLETMSVAAARQRYEAVVVNQPVPRSVGEVADRTIEGPGGPLRLRVYRPLDAPAGPLPLLVFFHGSGFVLCSLETHDGMCRNLCAGSGYVVVSVDYRLAPEHKFPAATDDCLAATRWIGLHAAELEGDAARIVVCGDSAGGNLAAVTAVRARDEGGPALAGQLLIYPVTGHYTKPTRSWEENGAGCGLTREGMSWFLDHYLRSPADALNPLVTPLESASLAGLPPALVQVAEYDLLRDEGVAYADMLKAAGVPTTLTCWPGMNHGFMQWAGHVDVAGSAMDEATLWLRAIVSS